MNDIAMNWLIGGVVYGFIFRFFLMERTLKEAVQYAPDQLKAKAKRMLAHEMTMEEEISFAIMIIITWPVDLIVQILSSFGSKKPNK